jgi:hypothetical protein
MIKDPYKIDPVLLEATKKLVLADIPNVRFSEGCKFGLWATVDGLVDELLLANLVLGLRPEQVYRDNLMGKDVTILMFLPFFK